MGLSLYLKLSVILILIILFIKFSLSDKYFISYIFIFFNHFLTITSISLISQYGDEAENYLNIPVADPYGSVFALYAIFCFSSIVIYKYIIAKSTIRWDDFFNKRIRHDKLNFYYLAVIIEMVPLIIGRFNGGIDFDRFQYINFVPGKELFRVYELIFQGISIYFIINANKLNKMLLIFFINSLILIFKGNEFGAILNQFFWLAISIRFNNIFLSKKYIAFGCIILTSIIAYKSFNLYNEMDVNNTTASPIIRLLMQGEIFTAVVSEPNFKSAPSIALDKYFSQFFTGIHARLNPEFGMGNLMVELMGDRGSRMVEDGVALSSGYPGIFIYNFGYILVLALINPLILYIVAKFLWGNFLKCITFGGLFLFAIYFRFFTIIMQIPIMGEYEMLTMINISGILLIALILSIKKYIINASRS